MPLFLKDIKKILAQDKDKVGRDADGDYKFKPPRIISRRLIDYAKLKVTALEKSLRVGVKIIDFSGIVPSETTVGKKYRVTVRFNDIMFSDKKNKVFTQEGKVGEDTVFYKMPTVNGNPVMLKCSCDDFRHRFEHQLADNDALIGAPRKYRRKTPLYPVGYPYANSTDKVGICKHVYSMVDFLKRQGHIKER